MIKRILPHKPVSFEWDKGNITKNWKKHEVSNDKCEQIFVNTPKVFADAKYSDREKRMTAYGKTDGGRCLTIVFTYRQLFIRVISARDQNKKEKAKYETKN